MKEKKKQNHFPVCCLPLVNFQSPEMGAVLILSLLSREMIADLLALPYWKSGTWVLTQAVFFYLASQCSSSIDPWPQWTFSYK